MAYTPTVWKDGQAPALNAENLNKIEQGISNAAQAIEAMTDPMGPWTYVGKITAIGESNKIELAGLTGGTFSSLVNQILLKINNIKSSGSGVYSSNFMLLLSSIDVNNSKYTMNIPFFSSQGNVESLNGSKFLFNKVGGNSTVALYSPTSYTQDGKLSDAYKITSFTDVAKIEAYLYWTYNVDELDADLYFR